VYFARIEHSTRNAIDEYERSKILEEKKTKENLQLQRVLICHCIPFMLMTEMAAVQQRTPTPVDPKQRTAFIESMEEEMRRVAEHLERRGTRRGVVAYGGSRPAYKSVEAVNGWSFTEGSGSEAGARRKRINKHPRTLSMPPEEDPPSGMSPC